MALIRETPAPRPGGSVPVLTLGALGIILISAFFLTPGSLSAKSYLALHGVCAQRLSHSLLLDGTPLPVDARMTGLYTGAAVAVLWLGVRGRLIQWRRVSRPTVAVLAVFLMALALDGLNALLVDLRLPHPYAPSNELRLATGIAAGTSLGVAVAFLFSLTAWRRPSHAVGTDLALGDVAPPLALSGAIGILPLTGNAFLLAPLSLWLFLATVLSFGAVAMLFLILVGGKAYRSWSELGVVAAASIMIAVAVIGGLAGFRFFLEHVLGLNYLT